MGGAAVGQLVAVDGGYYNITKIELGGGRGYLLGFMSQVFDRKPAPGLDRTKPTTARADIPEDHEGGGAAPEALVAIWATRLLAYRVQAASAEHLLQVVVGLGISRRLSQPLGQSRSRSVFQSLKLNEHNCDRAGSPQCWGQLRIITPFIPWAASSPATWSVSARVGYGPISTR